MHQIVILGSGFGGMTVFHHLATWASSHDVHITVIDERETFYLSHHYQRLRSVKNRCEM